MHTPPTSKNIDAFDWCFNATFTPVLLFRCGHVYFVKEAGVVGDNQRPSSEID